MAISIKDMAQQDLQTISDTFADRSLATADRFMRAVEGALGLLETMPELGSSWEFDSSRLANLRVLTVRGFRKYLIFYRPTNDGIEVIRVLHGAQNIDPSLFE